MSFVKVRGATGVEQAAAASAATTTSARLVMNLR
jgi:hypothetical protein